MRTMILKEIAKQPKKYIMETAFRRAILYVPVERRDGLTQEIMDRCVCLCVCVCVCVSVYPTETRMGVAF